jgi:hypothetical protein
MRFNRCLAVCMLAAMVAGCSSNSKSASAGSVKEDEAYCKSVKPGTVTSVNAMCVIMPEDPVDPATASRDFNGQKIGFCCPGCIGKWDKMSDTQKSAALATAMAAKAN